MPPKPPQVFIHQAQIKKNAAAAKNAKAELAVAKVDVKLAHVQQLLKRTKIDLRKIAELRALCEAAKKGNLGDPKKKVLIEGIKELIDLAKHHAELGQVEATLVQPAKAVVQMAGQLTGPNFLVG